MKDVKQFYTKYIAPVAGVTPYGEIKDETSPGANDGSTAFAGMITDLAYCIYQVLNKVGVTPNNVKETLDGGTPTQQQFILALIAGFLDRSEFSSKGHIAAGSGVLTPGSEIQYLASPGDDYVLKTNSSTSTGLQWLKSVSIGASGYYLTPNGLLFQWGNTVVAGDSDGTATFPLTFPIVCVNGQVSLDGTFDTGNDAGCSIRALTTTQATLRNGTTNSIVLRWLVWGN